MPTVPPYCLILGLQQQSLREHLAKREAFLASKAGLVGLKRWLRADADEMRKTSPAP